MCVTLPMSSRYRVKKFPIHSTCSRLPVWFSPSTPNPGSWEIDMCTSTMYTVLYVNLDGTTLANHLKFSKYGEVISYHLFGQQICFKTRSLQCLRDVPQRLMYMYLTIIYGRSHADRCTSVHCLDVSTFYEAFHRMCASEEGLIEGWKVETVRWCPSICMRSTLNYS